jgi:two-component system, chemotaxis family, chemotaxis protein CheY
MDKTVLVVEDSEIARFYISFFLTKEGYNVIEAEHGKDALNKLSSDGVIPAVVITDLNMPVMDGIEFVKQLRTTPSHSTVPVVIITGDSDEVKKHEAEQAGITFWLNKPFASWQLKDAVVKLTG